MGAGERLVEAGGAWVCPECESVPLLLVSRGHPTRSRLRPWIVGLLIVILVALALALWGYVASERAAEDLRQVEQERRERERADRKWAEDLVRPR